MNAIFRPCEMCVREKGCTLEKGRYQWKCWFRAYWAELRKAAAHRIGTKDLLWQDMVEGADS